MENEMIALALWIIVIELGLFTGGILWLLIGKDAASERWNEEKDFRRELLEWHNTAHLDADRRNRALESIVEMMLRKR